MTVINVVAVVSPGLRGQMLPNGERARDYAANIVVGAQTCVHRRRARRCSVRTPVNEEHNAHYREHH